jgi:hypothetical protein
MRGVHGMRNLTGLQLTEHFHFLAGDASFCCWYGAKGCFFPRMSFGFQP